MNDLRNHRTTRRTLTTLAAFTLALSSCGLSTDDGLTQAGGVVPGFQEDDRTLEEKVDTDGDGEMSEDEIQTYAQGVLLDFSNCMRENGYPDFTDVVLEDFTEGGGGGQGRFLALMTERGVSLGDATAIPTLQKCGEGLQDLQTFAAQPSDAEVAEREEQLLRFAGCMRDQGLANWPDPDFAANPGNGYGPALLQEFDIQSDEVQQAGAACQAEGNGFALDQGAEQDEETEADGEESADEQASDSGQDDGDTPSEPIDRAPISPLIEGDTSDLNVAEVTRRDLTQTKTLSGTLDFGEQRAFPTNTSGIVTALPAEGAVVELGETLFEIDNEPVLLMEGAIPQYRPFTINMSDGADVEQLEANLVRYGWADDLDLTVDEDFTAVTRDAIEEMQLQLGIEESGRIELGDVVFATTAVRVGAVNVELGQSISPQVTVLGITESEQRITLQLDAEDRSLLAVGTAVEIELPDGTTAPGTVSDVASVATRSLNPQTGTTNDPTIDVKVLFDGSAPDSVFDAAPVDIIVAEEVTSGVLTVPVPALIALSGGGHAVELIVEGGTQLIGVELGEFVDDIVEIEGDIQQGDRVVLATAG